MRGRPKKQPDDPNKETIEAYRKRAVTSSLVVEEGKWREKMMEAVWWPREGAYGGGTLCASRDDALANARKTLALGYGRDDKTEVHIVETRTRVIRVSLAPATEAGS